MANAAQAFIAFLRVEASSSEDRARSLRATAAAIEANAHEGKSSRRRECYFVAQVIVLSHSYDNLPFNQ
jgi:hypothetical protein